MIEELKSSLADDRIKHGVDYVVIRKYGETRIMCAEVWLEAIQEKVQSLGLVVEEYVVFDYQSKSETRVVQGNKKE